MGISVFLHQIPCWAELSKLLANMNDNEIKDLISIAWDYGTCIEWPGIGKFTPYSGSNSPVYDKFTERFSVALKYIHDKKIKGEYISKDIDIQLKCGGKNGKFWKLQTKGNSYTVSYGKLRNDSPISPQTMSKSFSTADECYKQAQKKIKEKKKKKYKVDYDKSANGNGKYNNEYLELAQKIEEMSHPSAQKKKQFANVISVGMKGVFGGDICFIISEFCNEDKIDHYDCDKLFQDFQKKAPITRLLESVKTTKDEAPFAADSDYLLFDEIWGKSEYFGDMVTGYGGINVYSPKVMKIFASRMIRRLMKDGDDELKEIIFGIDEIHIEEKKKDSNTNEPSVKRRKLNDSNIKNIDGEDVLGNDEIYKVAYALSASGIFDKKKQSVVWKKIFRLEENDISWESYESNHSLSVLCFGLNAAAMNRGVITHFW